MNRRALFLAWGLWGLSVLLTLAAVGLIVALGRARASVPADLDFGLADAVGALLLLVFPSVGAIIASRRPEHRIGWLFCGIGVAWAVYIFVDAYTYYGYYGVSAESGSLPALNVAALVASWFASVNILVVASFVLLLFPDGHLLSPRWRWVVRLIAVGFAGISVAKFFMPGTVYDLSGLNNPLGISALRDLLPPISRISTLLLILMIVVSAVSTVLRLRRSRGDERQQLKWFAFAAALVGITFVLVAVLAATTSLSEVLLGAMVIAALMGIPIAAGIAILRYRLYDIDRIINRTLVYGVLTALLGAIYLGGVLVLQLAFATVTRGSDLAVAGSTLAIAALFQPARRRVQFTVDRRFYRHRYDARQALAAFGVAARDEVDLDRLTASLAGLIAATVQPEHVSIWLRDLPGRAEAIIAEPEAMAIGQRVEPGVGMEPAS